MSYAKGRATKLSANFKSTEFDCHGKDCCTKTEIDSKLINYLQKIREHFGKAVNISSGYRCPVHNKNVGGATGSRHAKGQAADIYITGVTPIEIARYAENLGVKGIGLYETEKDGFFVHIDTRTTKSFWYGQAQAYRDTFQAKETLKPTIDTAAADPKKMWDYFATTEMTEAGIAGVMGNLYAESGLRSTNLEQVYEKKLGMSDVDYTTGVDNGTYTNFIKDCAGYGLAQWTYWTLKRDMLQFHQKKGKSIGDLQTQMEFLVYQLSTQYKGVWKILTTTNSTLEASNAMLLQFERPADQSLNMQAIRGSYSQKYYDKFASKKPAPEVQKPTQNTQSKPTLRKGSSGDEVRLLQTELRRLGFDCKGADGIYGADTQNAVIGLQRERNLSPDGACGPLTWAEIYVFTQYKAVVTASALNIRSGPSVTSSVKGILRKNATQTIVYEKNGWGKLINGAGWIALNYVSKI